MEKISEFIVKARYVIVGFFAALFIFSIFSGLWVEIEEDTVRFLDSSTESKQCLDIDAREFTAFGDVYLMVKNLSQDEVDHLREQVNACDNIFYRDETVNEAEDGSLTAVYYVSFMSESGSPKTLDSIHELSDIAGMYKENYVYSDDIDVMGEIVEQGMLSVILVVAAAVLLILVLTSGSYFEVPLLLIVFAASAVINMGSNFLLGTISLISNAVSIVLQLALSMDYAIIFFNRYREAHETLECRPAVAKALAGAAPEILASSLTTIAGLLAMTFMRFRLGLDMGLVLIKAIFTSLFTVFTLMPALITMCGKLLDRTRHRSLLPNIRFIGAFAAKSCMVVPWIFAALVVGACILSGRCNFITNEMMAPARSYSDETIAYNAIVDEIGMNRLEIIVPSGDYGKERELIDRYSAKDHVISVSGIANTEALDGYFLADDIGWEDITKLADVDRLTAESALVYYAVTHGDAEALAADAENYKAPLINLFTLLYENINNPMLEIPADLKAQISDLHVMLDRVDREMQGTHYNRIAVEIDLPMESDETFDLLDDILAEGRAVFGDDVHIAGTSMIYHEFDQSFSTDRILISVLSIALVLIILFLTFRNLILPVLLIVVIQGSIWINFAIPALTRGPVYFIGYLLVSAIMMGSNIDYAIVISSRYLELRQECDDRRRVITETMRFAFPTVITSGGILSLSGLMIYFFVSEGVVAGFGLYLGTGTLITMCLVLFALPQILVLCDGIIMKSALRPAKRRRRYSILPFLGQRIPAALLAVVCVLTLLISSAGSAVRLVRVNREIEEYRSDSKRILALDPDIKNYRNHVKAIDFLKLTEQFVTDSVGQDEIEKGVEELDEGREQLEAAQSEYDMYYGQYEAGLEEYTEGAEEYNKYLKMYNDGVAEYEAGKRAYDDAYAKYTQGQAQYDKGLARYNAGMAEYEKNLAAYNTAQSQFSSISAIYNAVSTTYTRYFDLQNKYDTAVKNNDLASAALYGASLAAAKAAYETDLSGTGYSMSALVAEYNKTKSQLDSAKSQLASAEKQLAAGKQELADGKAALADGKNQLAAGKKELEDAEKQLADFKKQLDAAKAELDAGKKELEKSKKELDAGKKQLDEGYDEYAAGEQQLRDAEEYLVENRELIQTGVQELDEINAERFDINLQIHAFHSYPELLQEHLEDVDRISEAGNYIRERIDDLKHEKTCVIISLSLVIAAALLGLMSSLMWLSGSDNLGAALAPAIFSAALSAASAILLPFLSVSCAWILIPACAVFISAVLGAVFIVYEYSE